MRAPVRVLRGGSSLQTTPTKTHRKVRLVGTRLICQIGSSLPMNKELTWRLTPCLARSSRPRGVQQGDETLTAFPAHHVFYLANWGRLYLMTYKKIHPRCSDYGSRLDIWLFTKLRRISFRCVPSSLPILRSISRSRTQFNEDGKADRKPPKAAS